MSKMTAAEKTLILDTYKWIKIKRFDDSIYDTVEEKYAALLLHHKEETEFLINFVREIVANE